LFSGSADHVSTAASAGAFLPCRGPALKSPEALRREPWVVGSSSWTQQASQVVCPSEVGAEMDTSAPVLPRGRASACHGVPWPRRLLCPELQDLAEQGTLVGSFRKLGARGGPSAHSGLQPVGADEPRWGWGGVRPGRRSPPGGRGVAARARPPPSLAAPPVPLSSEERPLLTDRRGMSSGGSSHVMLRRSSSSPSRGSNFQPPPWEQRRAGWRRRGFAAARPGRGGQQHRDGARPPGSHVQGCWCG
jgi:hypothetical protein